MELSCNFTIGLAIEWNSWLSSYHKQADCKPTNADCAWPSARTDVCRSLNNDMDATDSTPTKAQIMAMNQTFLGKQCDS